jgi:hypothetical protein
VLRIPTLTTLGSTETKRECLLAAVIGSSTEHSSSLVETNCRSTETRLSETSCRLTETNSHLTETNSHLTETSSRSAGAGCRLTETICRLTALDVPLVSAHDLVRLCATRLVIRRLKLRCDQVFEFQCLAQLDALEHLCIDGCRRIDLLMTDLADTLEHASPRTNEVALGRIWPTMKSLRSLTIHNALTHPNLATLKRHYKNVDTSKSVAHRPYEAPFVDTLPYLDDYIPPNTMLCTRTSCSIIHKQSAHLRFRLQRDATQFIRVFVRFSTRIYRYH